MNMKTLYISYKRCVTKYKTLQQHCTDILLYTFIIIKMYCLYFVKKQQRENDGLNWEIHRVLLSWSPCVNWSKKPLLLNIRTQQNSSVWVYLMTRELSKIWAKHLQKNRRYAGHNDDKHVNTCNCLLHLYVTKKNSTSSSLYWSK